MDADLVVVGAGLFGLTVAERVANDLGRKVVILERRSHIGGNAWSEVEPTTGIEVHRYGAHLFHTSNKRVWDYVNQFTSFTGYQHHVYTTHNGVVYPMPVNLGTINQFFQAAYRPDGACPHQGAVAGAGRQRARQLRREGYPARRASAVRGVLHELHRQAVADGPRTCRRPSSAGCRCATPTNRYFNDTYEGLPTDGYGARLTRMVDNPLITVYTDTDFFDDSHEYSKSKVVGKIPVVYTGPVDRYFDYSEGDLTWRTIDLTEEVLLDCGDFQGTSVMNYADLDTAFTRIHEFRHFHPERDYPNDRTVIHREYSRFADRDDEPYYPINTDDDRARLARYRQAAAAEPAVIFGGRLGTYKYLDMHMAIASALVTYDNVLKPHFSDGEPVKSGGVEA